MCLLKALANDCRKASVTVVPDCTIKTLDAQKCYEKLAFSYFHYKEGTSFNNDNSIFNIRNHLPMELTLK